jgi:glycosyltransferase involved in cell wall biosynthesis
MLEEKNPSIAVLLPCYNEEVTIGKVVRDFRVALPDAAIYVYDNNSTDRTAEIATAEGAYAKSRVKARATSSAPCSKTSTRTCT